MLCRRERKTVRLLMAMADPGRAETLATLLYSRWEGWQIAFCREAGAALEQLREGEYGMLLLCLGQTGNQRVLCGLTGGSCLCLPRVLLLGEQALAASPKPDCTAPATAGTEQLCRLLEILRKKPLPHLATQMKQRLDALAETFLDGLSMPRSLKGRSYAAWLLPAFVVAGQDGAGAMGAWYRRCAEAFQTTPGAVERCLRVAVESVFTQGNMQAIERCFGATVDPDKGKPTNRAFLIKAAEYLRSAGHSLTDTRSLNSSEMHHRPAAPTSV
jgi:hypothetical protein